jgi:hypothetical protein
MFVFAHFGHGFATSVTGFIFLQPSGHIKKKATKPNGLLPYMSVFFTGIHRK